MKILSKLLLNSGAVLFAAYILPGIRIDGFWYAVAVAIVLGFLNFFLKPLLTILTLPITLVTFGLFLFVINAAIIFLARDLVSGFHVDGFLWAIAFSLVFSVIKSVFDSVLN